MRWILKIAYRFIKASSGRNILTGLGVALGVTLATALLTTNISMKKTLDNQITARYGNFDIQVGYRKEGSYLTGEQVQQVSEITGVSGMSKVLIPYVFPIPKEVYSRANYWGVETNSPEMQKYKVLQGRYPREGTEVAISAALARREKLSVGDNTTFPFPPYGDKTVKIVGVLDPPVTGGGDSMAFFPLSWVQDTMHLPNRVNLIQLDLTKGTNKMFVASKIKELYPDVEFDLRNYVDKAYKRLDTFQPMVYGLGILAMFTGAILVMGSFYLSVRSRSDYWAILRAIGSTSRGIVGIIAAEALYIGAIGTVIGIFGGIGLSLIISSIIDSWFQLEGINIVISPATLVIVFFTGVILAILGALFPAFVARNVPPAQALRPGIPLAQYIKGKARYFGLILVIIGIVIEISSQWVPRGDGGPPLLVSSLGGFVLCLGLLFSVPHLISLSMTVLANPLKFLGIEATMAARNVIRHRQRAGFAVAILALGFILALAAEIFMDTSLDLIKTTTRKSMPTDLIVRIPNTTIGYLDPELKSDIATIPGVDRVAAVGSNVLGTLVNFDFKNADPKWLNFADSDPNDPFRRDVVEIYPADTVNLGKMLSLSVIEGKPLNAELQPGEAFMTKDMAKRLGISLGDTLNIQPEDGVNSPQKVKVISLVEDYPMVRGVPFFFVNLDWGMKAFGSKGFETIHVNLSHSMRSEIIEPTIQSLINSNSSAEYVSYEKAIKEQYDFFSRQLLLIRALIGVVFGIACIGLINSIVSSLHDRRWETGVIQAIGATPKQIFVMVGFEGIFMGIIGGSMGLFGGSTLAVFLLRALRFSKFKFPWETAGTLFAISIAIGIISSVIAILWVRRTTPSQVMRN